MSRFRTGQPKSNGQRQEIKTRTRCKMWQSCPEPGQPGSSLLFSCPAPMSPLWPLPHITSLFAFPPFHFRNPKTEMWVSSVTSTLFLTHHSLLAITGALRADTVFSPHPSFPQRPSAAIDSFIKELQCEGARVEFGTSVPGEPAVSGGRQIINCLSLAGDDLSVLNSGFPGTKQP